MPPKRRHHLSHLFSKLHTGEALVIRRREPTPLDPTRPSVAQLPEHVVRCILAWLNEMRPDAVSAVASLSASLYQLARSVQHSEVHVDLDKSRHVLDRLDLVQRLDQLPAVRILRVDGHECHDPDGQERSTQILARLAALLPSMTGLRHLHWRVGSTVPKPSFDSAPPKEIAVPIPAAILAALPGGSSLHTAVFCTERREEQMLAAHLQVRTFLQRLVACQNLCTLHVQITFIEEEHCLRTMRELKRVLMSCPNLTRLPCIDVWYPRGGCLGYGPPIDGLYCGLGFSNSERPQPLTELGIRDYPWGIQGAPNYQGYPADASKYEWDYWIDFFDWSRLERLHDTDPRLTPRIAPKLTNLRELMLEEQQAGHLDAGFVDDITAPLELIGLTGWHRIKSKPESISRFGETLRELKLHESESGWGNKNHAFITAADLVHLSKSLPHLEHLRLDIPRDKETQEWPYKALDAIAAFPRLRTVELWFPLGREAPAPKPQLTVSSVPHLLRYLHERNKYIMSATLHSGDPSPPSAFGVAMLPSNAWAWDMHSTITFVCAMVYDNDSPDGRVDVWCPELSIEMNDKLHQLAQQTDRKRTNVKRLDTDELRLMVALDGPLDAQDWGAWKYVQMCESRDREKKQERRMAMKKVIPSLKRALER